MGIPAVMQQYMQVALRFGSECGKEFFGELAVKLTDPLALQPLHAPNEGRSAAKVERHRGQNFVHRQRSPSVASDAGAVAERLFKRAAEHETDVFDRVVRIDFDVALRDNRQIKYAVPRKRIEHVRQKRHWRIDRTRTHPIDRQLQGDLGFGGVALYFRSTRHATLYQLRTDRTTIDMAAKRFFLALFAVACACGGSTTTTGTAQPPGSMEAGKPPSKPDSSPQPEREPTREAGGLSIVSPGSSCLPKKIKEDRSLKLELASVGKDPILCVLDTDKSRLAGPIGCWKVDLLKMGANSVPIVYRPAAPLPNHNIDAAVVDRCAREFCVPDGAKLPDGSVAHLSWNNDATKVAALIGDDVHLFDASTKAHQSSFSVRGEKGLAGDPEAIYLVGETVFVIASEQGHRTGVWVFRSNGKQLGAINPLGGKDKKPVSPHRGAFSVLDPGHVAIADRGMETLTTYEVETGKRTKSVRKLPKLPCKANEIEAFWSETGKVGTKCKAALEAASGVFIGATAVMGSTNLLVALQGERLGELAVIDPKSLAERRKSLSVPWCDEH